MDITLLKIQACIITVIAYGKVGVFEMVRGLKQEDSTGVLLVGEIVKNICGAILACEHRENKILYSVYRHNVERISEGV